MINELISLRELTHTLVTKDDLLVEQTNNWKFILDAVPDLVFISSIDGNVLFCNKALKSRLSNKKLEEIRALPCLDKIKQMLTEDGAYYQTTITEKPEEIELRDLNGWFSHSISPIKDEFGLLIGFICLLKDITDRRKVVAELERSEKKFRSIVEVTIDAIIVANQAGRIIDWNSAAEDMFGYTKDEITDKPLTVIIPERYRKKHLDKFNKRRRKTDPSSDYIGKIIRLEGLHKNGTSFPVDLIISSWVIDNNVFFSGIIRGMAYSEDFINMTA